MWVQPRHPPEVRGSRWVDVILVFQIATEREKELQKQEEEREQSSVALKKAKEEQAPKTFKAGVGKYINPATM